MSKGSLFWANASGKLGESVFYRSGGEQRNRSYVKNIKNPRTEAQMRNRIQLGNWASMYRRLKPILSKTFTNRPSSESGFNALVKANKSRLRYGTDQEMLSSCDYNCIGAKVASGTIICNIQPEGIAYKDPSEKGTPARYYTHLMALAPTQFKLAAENSPTDGLMGKEIYQLMTANGNPMQLPSDFKVIVLYGNYEIDDETGEYTTGGGMPLSYRIYDCNATNETTGTFVGNSMFDSLTELKAHGSDFVHGESGAADTLRVDGLMIGGYLASDDMQEACLGMIIYYENASGKNANNAFIYGYPRAVELALDFSEGGEVFVQMLENIGFSPDSILSGTSASVRGDLRKYTIALPEAESDGGMGEEEP